MDGEECEGMNPLELAAEIEDSYRRYLASSFYFSDPVLRASFEKTLRADTLAKGPFLEATPVFKRGMTSGDLLRNLQSSKPDPGFMKAVKYAQPLYQHQEESIRRALLGSNVVVATGTGSGKTEAFLYPILFHLYREFHSRNLGPGVRALVLYPMNALANDQRERLGEIAGVLEKEQSPFRFTFGQYTGETPEDEHDSFRGAQAHIANRLPGELVLRTEMRRTPPHILLTNYSMLEYLLLRPDDSPLFDSGNARWWTYLVLDEAHQYRGSRGIEMAMLLRRLKQRLREGGRIEPFQCIATSATLAGGESDKADVASFASDLFGEAFSAEDVILGETEPIPESPGSALGPSDYGLLWCALQAPETDHRAIIFEVGQKLGVSLGLQRDNMKRAIGAILQQDRRSEHLRRLISGRAVEVRNVAAEVFHDLADAEQVPALAHLVSLLLHAEAPDSGAPLLSARYHLFLRSLEGAFVSYWPEKKVLLDRKAPANGKAAFEVALCRECGQHYFVGQVRNGKLVEATHDPGEPSQGAEFFRPLDNNAVENEDESEAASGRRALLLCTCCGRISDECLGRLTCSHPDEATLRVVSQAVPRDKDRTDQMARCEVCGYNAGGRDPVREVVYGADGPNAVIATALHCNLPEKRRKILAFADSRQDAAFFAWYLDRSYADIYSRSLLLRAIRELGPHTRNGLSLRELARRLSELFVEEGVLSPRSGDLELRRQAWLHLYREFLTDERRISLEGVGLVQWSIKWPDWFGVPNVFTREPWSLNEREARDLAFALLDSMRADRAVQLCTEKGISLSWSDLGLTASQMRFQIGPPKRTTGVRSWVGKTGKRALLLVKLLSKIAGELSDEERMASAIEALRSLWDFMWQCDLKAPSSEDRLLISVDDAKRLNPDWWRVKPLSSSEVLFQCDICSRLQTLSLRGVCPRHRCPGTLREVHQDAVSYNHYRVIYQKPLCGTMRVEEHTAQLDKEKAREFQREFKEGKIHVLSCSTTFELGVHLGDLDTVFLRNVPPEAFNYAQRVGRAGRSGNPGIAVTYCRRGPHDLYHFAKPERMLSGKVRRAVLSVRNDKIITRHITAVALSAFFRTFPERFCCVEGFLRDLANPKGADDFRAFALAHQRELEESLKTVVPPEMHRSTGLEDGSWIDKITNDSSRLRDAEAETASDYRSVQDFRQSALQDERIDDFKWAKDRTNTLRSEETLSFLSRKAVIPKYGFPVDVVELDPQRLQYGETAEVSLQRDLSVAIAEFAPTSSLVANKKLWTSCGLKRVAGREWPRYYYKRCTKHNVFLRWRKGEAEPALPCGDAAVPREYVIPCFGFVTGRKQQTEPRSRPARMFTSRPYFVGLTGGDPGSVTFSSKRALFTIRKASPGKMVVLCEGRRGQGFYICKTCGAGFRSALRPHKTPQGMDCVGTFDLLSLGHEFETDVLQLQFHLQPEGTLEPVWFAFSLAYALAEGAAEVLDVPSTDLSTTVAHAVEDLVPPIILYDNVPGGAGLVARLECEKDLRACLEASLKRVTGSCGCDASCYGCLRSYRNQFAHEHLDRGPVARYLEELLSEWTQ